VLSPCSTPFPLPPLYFGSGKKRKEELPFPETKAKTQRTLLLLFLNCRPGIQMRIFPIREHMLLGGLIIVYMV